MNRDTSTATPQRAASAAQRLGRRVGITIFWVFAAYVVGMSVRSIVPALFFPQYAPRPAPVAAERCASELAALEDELAVRTGAYLRERGARGAQHWLSTWDRRYLALSGGCGPLENVRVELGAARDQIESLLQRYSRTTGAEQQRIHRALEALPGAHDELPKES